MKRPNGKISSIAVISLLLSVIWLSVANAAVPPAIQSLGRIQDYSVLSTSGRIDIDASGNIYVTDARKGHVVKFDKYGKHVRSYSGMPITGSGIAVTPDGGRIYIAGGTEVTILDGATGDVLGKLGSATPEFQITGEIDLDASGFIFVADAGSAYIKVYGPDGTYKYRFGGRGTVLGQFRSIWAMSVNEQAGEVYAADVETYGGSYPKIQVFGLDGTYRRSLLASNGFGTPAMTFFGGFTFDSAGRGYFPDSFRNHLRILGLPATYLRTFGVSGYEVGQFMAPIDAVFDPSTSRLFVSCDGSRIEIFGIDGGQNPTKANAAPSAPTPLSPVDESEVASATPELLFQNAIDPDGNVLTYQVRVLSADGAVAEYNDLAEGESTSVAVVGATLNENARYQWKVQSFDGEEVSGWSGLQSFYVNAIQEPPSAPVMIAPAAGEVLDGESQLSWGAAVDPDPFDTVSYIVEISEDPSFAAPIARQSSMDTSLSLGGFDDYDKLQDGTAYFWRVLATDNHNLLSEEGTIADFTFDTTILKVSSNLPGAKVYLGGNQGYAGRFMGEAPLEIRDFPVGPCSIVVERPGFEPFVAQVQAEGRENINVYAELVPAIKPAELRARPLQAGGANIVLDGDAAPFGVDFDNDGLTDLLVGDASGALNFYKGAMSPEGVFSYAAGSGLGLPLVPGASPFVADWDSDGRKDLLVGAADGTLLLYLNSGTETAPAFGAGEFLMVGGQPLVVGASAVPAIIDIDNDGDKDLVVGSASGAVTLFRNSGSDTAPLLAVAGTLAKLPSPVAPFFVDWDADGTRELLAVASEHLYIYKRKADGLYAPSEVLTVGDGLVGHAGNSAAGAYSLGTGLRVFAFDADGRKGKDLVVGNATGEVRLARSNGSLRVAAFAEALRAKVAQIDGMVRESAPDATPLVAEISSAIDAGDYKGAARKCGQLSADLVPGTDIANSVEELSRLLI